MDYLGAWLGDMRRSVYTVNLFVIVGTYRLSALCIFGFTLGIRLLFYSPF